MLSFVFNSHHTFACSLRSSSGRKCSVTRVHSRFGDRCFAAAGPRIWNNLPASLRDKEVSCTEFRKQLKTFMFQRDCGASWLFSLLRLINTLTYLLTYLLTKLRWFEHDKPTVLTLSKKFFNYCGGTHEYLALLAQWCWFIYHLLHNFIAL